ncbi:MAG TPA: hypothetical protein VL949_11055, partial [Geobacteraceae bacterium]|nr:hypothetical protein [Geobacteraceae bacterium]
CPRHPAAIFTPSYPNHQAFTEMPLVMFGLRPVSDRRRQRTEAGSSSAVTEKNERASCRM